MILFSLLGNELALGLTAHHGAITAALANLGIAVGRPVVGYFSDSLGKMNTAMGATLLSGIFCFAI